jgi:predicted PurR-regulated permease PerM
LVNIYLINVNLFLAFIGFLSILITIIVILNKHISKYRKAYKEKHIETMRHYVRILQGKFEILQNDKLQYELDKIKSIRDEARGIMYNVMTYIESMFTLGRVFTWGMR